MATMKSKSIQIFKPGKHTAMSGVALSFSESDLIATAKAYDPAKHEAPFTIGHPKDDLPAYAWVGALNYADGLEAAPQQIDPAFAEMVERGAFKKISASFYAPDSPSNPVPGVYYLRHVALLGAQAPAVKGLRNPSFAEAEQGVIEFAEYDDVTVASLFRRLREWIIGKDGLAVADKVINSYDLSSLETSAQDELKKAQSESLDPSASPSPAFTEPQSKGDEMSAEEKAQLAALKAENDKLKADQIAFAEADKKRTSDARHVEHINFADGLIKEGKLLPAYKELVAATMDHFSAPEQVIEFGEGEEKKPLLDALKGFLTAQPKLVEFSEVAGATNEGISLSDDEIAKRARAYKVRLDSNGENISFAEAVDAVVAGKDKP